MDFDIKTMEWLSHQGESAYDWAHFDHRRGRAVQPILDSHEGKMGYEIPAYILLTDVEYVAWRLTHGS